MTTDVLAVTAVMAKDAARLETGLALLGARLAGAGGPVGAFMLDVDGSAAIRQKGLPAKRALVGELQHLVRTVIPAERGLVIDSGTRDEILVVLPGPTAADCTRQATELLAAIRAHPFRSEYWDGDLHVTASIGATLLDPQLPPDVAFATARAALAVAKKDRDCVRFAADDAEPVPVPATSPDASDIELAEAVTRGVRRAEEKYGPMWYWLSGTAQIPDDALRQAATVGTDHDVVFLALVAEIRAESGTSAVKGHALARYEVARPASVRHVALGAWTRGTLRRLCDELGVSQDHVLHEALRLADIDREPAAAVAG